MPIILCNNYPVLTHDKPENWTNEGYQIQIPYPFEERKTLGKATCDCTIIKVTYQPWYGISWHHGQNCAIKKHIRRYPGILNIVEDAGD